MELPLTVIQTVCDKRPDQHGKYGLSDHCQYIQYRININVWYFYGKNDYTEHGTADYAKHQCRFLSKLCNQFWHKRETDDNDRHTCKTKQSHCRGISIVLFEYITSNLV